MAIETRSPPSTALYSFCPTSRFTVSMKTVWMDTHTYTPQCFCVLKSISSPIRMTIRRTVPASAESHSFFTKLRSTYFLLIHTSFAWLRRVRGERGGCRREGGERKRSRVPERRCREPKWLVWSSTSVHYLKYPTLIKIRQGNVAHQKEIH